MKQILSGIIVSVLLIVTVFAVFPVFPPVDSVSVQAQDGEPGTVPAGLPDKGNPKLDSALNRMVNSLQTEATNAFPGQSASGSGDRVQVIIECSTDDYSPVLNSVRSQGATFETGHGNLLQVSVPVASLTAMTENRNINLIRLPMEPLYEEITSQGVAVIHADAWHAAGITGAGVKIGVLDGGFTGYQDLQGTELPDTVTALSFRSDQNLSTTTHGTACAEIVHDVAPDALMYLVNFGTELEYVDAVNWLIDQRVDVITSSVGWPISGPGDGTGIIDDAINTAANAGIFVSISAGNSANRYWEGDWSDTDNDRYLDFSSLSNGDMINVTAGNNIAIGLVWDDPWDASTNDYDLFLYYGTNYIAGSGRTQTGSTAPQEVISVTNAPYTGAYTIMIQAVHSPAPVHFRLFSYYQDLSEKTVDGSIMIPADAENITAVGAVPYYNPDTIEYFSSHGPTQDGRVKPDIVAPDAVQTQSSSSFSGTSVAAPHAGGAAALVKQAFPGYSREAITAFLEGNAVDLGSPGKDTTFGYGRLNLGSPDAIPPRLLSVEISPTNPEMLSGRTRQFTATGLYSDNTTLNITSNVTWTSGNTSIITIDPHQSLATGHRGGQTFITAEMDGVTNSTGISVVTSLEVNSGIPVVLPFGRQITGNATSGIPVTVKGLPASFSGSNGLQSFSVNLTWNPAVIDLTSVSQSSEALSSGWNINAGVIDHTAGRVTIDGSASSSAFDDFTLCNLGITATGSVGNITAITIAGDQLFTGDLQPVPVVLLPGEVRIVTEGDANGDGNVDVLDISKVIRIIMGIDPQVPAGDATADGTISILDITKIVKIILGID